MTTLLTTVTIAIILVLLAIGGISIGWLITGKSRLRLGMCGRNPHEKKDENCGKDISCSLCDKKEKK